LQQSLIYVHDPMCSWCWGFEPVRQQLFSALTDKINIVRLVGGLAPDSDELMPIEMQSFLQQTWQKIEQAIPDTQFNFDFWTQCQPRRSTYPANRAVIAARQQGEKYDELMTHRIQQAYYTEAKNPSDNEVLIALADDIGLDVKQFSQDLTSAQTQQQLTQEITLTRQLGMNSFPSLSVQYGEQLFAINLDYNNAENMLTQINVIRQK